MRRQIRLRWLMIVLLAGCLGAACGQKGPLTLPEPPDARHAV